MIAALRLLPGETGAVSWGTYDKWDWSITSFRILSSVEDNTKEKGDIFDQAVDKWTSEDKKEEKKSNVDEGLEDVKENTEIVSETEESQELHDPKKLLSKYSNLK